MLLLTKCSIRMKLEPTLTNKGPSEDQARIKEGLTHFLPNFTFPLLELIWFLVNWLIGHWLNWWFNNVGVAINANFTNALPWLYCYKHFLWTFLQTFYSEKKIYMWFHINTQKLSKSKLLLVFDVLKSVIKGKVHFTKHILENGPFGVLLFCVFVLIG